MSQFGSFLRLLIRWRGSIYKLVLTEYERIEIFHQTEFISHFRYFIWLTIYMILSILYRFAFNDSQRSGFEVVLKELCRLKNSDIPYLQAFANFCITWSKLIPLNFILAFYVAQVVTRWWSQWNVRSKSKLYFFQCSN